MKRITQLALTVAVAGSLAAPMDAAAQYQFPGPGFVTLGPANYLVATGQEVYIQYLGYEASYEDQLSFALSYGGTTYFVFDNKTSTVGSTFRLNDFIEQVTASAFYFTPGEEIVFSMYVGDTSGWPAGDPDDAGKTYYTGSPTRNPDGLDHAMFATWAGSGAYTPMAGSVTGVAGTIAFDRQVGFEDILSDGDLPDPDWDFDDLVFATQGVEVTPEPASLILLFSGLMGVGGVAYRRRRQDDQA